MNNQTTNEAQTPIKQIIRRQCIVETISSNDKESLNIYFKLNTNQKYK